MKKRIVSVLLVFVMIFSSIASFAAEGDIIHTGLKKIYRKDNTRDQEELLNDILNGVKIENFYRETKDGKYINVKAEEEAQIKALQELVQEKGLRTPEEIQKYLSEHSSELQDRLKNATLGLEKDLSNIPNGGNIEEYRDASQAPMLNSKNYSIPEPGVKEKSTKISTLNLPDNATGWRIKVLNNPIEPMVKDTILEGGNSYIKGRDIEIEIGKYLVLYAVDNGNRIKAYANIKITEEMIKKPKEEAIKLEMGIIEKGKKYAGTIIISELDKLPEGASKWQIIVRNTSIDKIYSGEKLNEALDYTNDEISIADEYELENMNDKFKKYLILLATDNDGKILGYREFEIGKNDISIAPKLLKETTHYIGPMQGQKEGTTRFTNLNFGIGPTDSMSEATKWQVKVYSEKPPIPILNSKINETFDYDFDGENADIDISPREYLILLATDNDGKIKGYRIFKINEDQIKGKTAPELLDGKNYSIPEKGSKTGTTKITMLKFDGIAGNPTKWMYKVGTQLSPPVLDKVVEESLDYTVGQDIKIDIEEKLLLLATNDEGKVKGYKIFDMDKNMIKDPPPILLKDGFHYSQPVKGNTVGTTKFEILAFTDSLKDANQWRYKISSKPFDVPELDSIIDKAIEFKVLDSIGTNLKGNEHLLLLATDNLGKTKGYAVFQLNENQVKMPNAPELKKDLNYSQIEPGTASGTTRVVGLNFIGLPESTNQWRYKVQDKEFPNLELNSTLDGAIVYNPGSNIRISEGEYLALLATDGGGKIKAYATFKVTKEQIKSPNAKFLAPTTNYSEPIPGNVENSTKFSFLSFSGIDGASKWMYKIDDRSFGSIGLDNIVEGSKSFDGANTNISPVKEEQYLLLLATDVDGKVKAYREFRLSDSNIRGENAPKLQNTNYKVQAGTLPGTSKLTNLGFWGIEGATRWKVKVITDENTKTQIENSIYNNSIVEGSYFYNENQDIQVLLGQYILILATDNSGKTKAYDFVKIEKNMVREYAPEIGDVELKEGSDIDTVRITGSIPDGTNAQIIVQNAAFTTPALDQVLTGGKNYTLGTDIEVVFGQNIGLYAIDSENKIKGFKFYELTGENGDKIKKATATMKSSKSDNIIPEGSIVIGGEKITITLTDAKWSQDIRTNELKRIALYNGFKPNNQSSEWTKVVNAMIADGSGAISRDSDEKLTILLPEVSKYDIREKQEISLTIPANCIDGATSSVKVNETLNILPTVKATISGDVVSSIVREKDIVAGGKTIVIEIQDGSLESTIDRDKLIGGFKVVDTDNNWNKIASKIDTSHIVRNSSKKVTITLPKISDFTMGTNKETIKLEIPKELIEGATSDVIATPAFSIYPDIIQIDGKAVEHNDSISMIAPDQREIKKDKNTWTLEITNSTLKDEITNNDIAIIGLPTGLKGEVKRIDDKHISITVSGVANTSLKEKQTVKIRIKGSAVVELNSLDSKDIDVFIEPGIAKSLDKVEYELKFKENELLLYLTGVDEEMEYSKNSTNGTNGNWTKIVLAENTNEINIGKAEPMKIYVRESTQPKVFREVSTLAYGEMPKDVYVEKIEYVKENDNFYGKVSLKGIDNTMEYSKDSGKTWSGIDDVDNLEILLDETSDLRIRKKAIVGKNGSLPSLPTNRLNGLFLGNTFMNAGEGKLIYTNTSMEYSLNGKDGTFTATKNNETPVNFVKGNNVWIRERNNSTNSIELGTVGQEEKPDIENITFDIGEGKINNATAQDLEYRIGDGNWQKINANNVANNVEFKAGNLEFRKRGNLTNLPSIPVKKATIVPPGDGPKLKTDDFKKEIYYFENSSWHILDDKYEYKIGSTGNWQLGSNLNKDENRNENVLVYVRKKATSSELASNPTSVNFTKNIELNNVKINVAENAILGTKSTMEYSTNSTDGLDGNWKICNEGKTTLEFGQGMNIWIREKSKPLNKLKIAENIQKENKPTLEYVYYNIATGKISNQTNQNLEYRINNGAWQKIYGNTDIYEVKFDWGRFEFRKIATENTLASNPVLKVNIKAPLSAPTIEYDDVKNTVKSINGKTASEWNLFEYRINPINKESPWISGELLAGEDLNGDKLLEIRAKATWDTLASKIGQIHFTPNLPLEAVSLSIHTTPIELNGTTDGMQYRIFLGNASNNWVYDGKWFDCDNGNTKLPDWLKKDNIYKIEIRDKNQTSNIITIWP